MKEKTKLRVIQILCIVSLLITVFSIQRTYARYYEKVDTTYATNIKKWLINVNNSNIHDNSTLSEIMVPILFENEHMNTNNTLVPGREGYFPFVIDYTNVDLAFQFQFNLEQINAMVLEDFEVYGFQIIDGENTNTIELLDWKNIDSNIDLLTKINPIIDPVTGSITYTRIITTEQDGGQVSEETQIVQELDTDKNVEIRILFRWNDLNKDTLDEVDIAGMNNYEDTTFVGEENVEDNLHTLLNYNVAITFIQYIMPIQEEVL